MSDPHPGASRHPSPDARARVRGVSLRVGEWVTRHQSRSRTRLAMRVLSRTRPDRGWGRYLATKEGLGVSARVGDDGRTGGRSRGGTGHCPGPPLHPGADRLRMRILAGGMRVYGQDVGLGEGVFGRDESRPDRRSAGRNKGACHAPVPGLVGEGGRIGDRSSRHGGRGRSAGGAHGLRPRANPPRSSPERVWPSPSSVTRTRADTQVCPYQPAPFPTPTAPPNTPPSFRACRGIRIVCSVGPRARFIAPLQTQHPLVIPRYRGIRSWWSFGPRAVHEPPLHLTSDRRAAQPCRRRADGR